MSSKNKNKPMPKRRNAAAVAAHSRNGGYMKNSKNRGGKSTQKRLAIQDACGG